MLVNFEDENLDSSHQQELETDSEDKMVCLW